MKTLITCAHCQIKFKIDLNTIPESGRAGVCPNCGDHLSVTVPGHSQSESTVSGAGQTTGASGLPEALAATLGSTRRKDRRLVHWSVALALALLITLGVTGGHRYVGLKNAFDQAQNRLATTTVIVDSERERFQQMERRHVRLRQEQAQRHLQEIRAITAQGAADLRRSREKHREEVKSFQARIRFLEAHNDSLTRLMTPKFGCIEGDCDNGRGTWLARNGDKYVGGWKSGKRHGKGVIYTAKGDLYAGQWFAGRRMGMGTWRLKFSKFMDGAMFPEDTEKKRLEQELQRLVDEKRKMEGDGHLPGQSS